MRKSIEQQQVQSAPLMQNVEPNSFGTASFGHPLDMLARTAANTHSPDMDRFSAGNSYNGITPPAQPVQRPSMRVGTSESITTTWTSDLSAIDPVERGWIDLEDARYYFERYFLVKACSDTDFGNICYRRCRYFLSALSDLTSNKYDVKSRFSFSV